MSRIKGRYVAQVVLEWDVQRTSETFPLEKIRHSICNGNMKNAITRALYDGLVDCTVTVDQQYADVYEVDDEDEGGQDGTV